MNNMEEFYEKNADAVYRFLLSLGAEETLFRGIKKIAAFRETCRLSTWLCAIARNLYYDEMRRRKRLLPLNETMNAALEDPEEETADKDDAERIRRIISGLPEPYGAVFSLRVLGEIPFCEISALYEKSESWARVTFFRAKIMITERLNGGNL